MDRKTRLFQRESFGAQQAGSSGQPKFVSTLTSRRFCCAHNVREIASGISGSTNVFNRRRHEEQTGRNACETTPPQSRLHASVQFQHAELVIKRRDELAQNPMRWSKRHSAWGTVCWSEGTWVGSTRTTPEHQVRHLFSA